MWTISTSVLLLISVATPVFGIVAGPLFIPTKGEVWPRPFQVVKDIGSFVFDPHKLEFKGEGEKCDIITDAAYRCRISLHRQSRGPLLEHGRYALTPRDDNLPELKIVVLQMIGECESNPYLNMDESYRLIVTTNRNGTGEVLIQSLTVWGMIRGLESFSQLSYFNGTLYQLAIGEVKIWDKPRFAHRGLMIDTARHYLSKRTIKQILEAMEYNKMNVLHWHVTDDQSFPYKSKIYPELSEFGAYHPDKVYKDKDIRDIIEHARVRGIRVVPEFDTPGHTTSWGLGHPEFVTKCFTSDGVPDGTTGPTDPTIPENYQFLENLLTEITQLFTDSHFHFGGDEVDFGCWKSNPYIRAFMNIHGFENNYSKLESYYIRKVLDMAADLKVSPVVWQEVFQNDNNLSNNTVVHVWSGNMKALLNQVTSAGYSAILSTCWYLDHFGMDLYAGGGDWKKFYECEPLDFPGTETMKQRVLGGEACMWGEVVDDTNIIQRVWPRACSAAERLWSTQFDVSLAAPRLEEHVCRMRRRGIMAQPPNGPSAC